LVFTLLVVANGYEPGFFKRQDPLQGDLDLRLNPRPEGAVPKKQLFLGRVMGPDKKPVPNAIVVVNSFGKGDGMSYGSPPDKMDPLAVTDEKGEFEIHCPEPYDFLGFRVDSDRFAKKSFERIAMDGTRKDLVLSTGATLKGRVLKDGKPISGITIGVAGTDRSAGKFVGSFVAHTDAEGRFEFSHLPDSQEYAVCGVMDSLRGVGALATRIVQLKDEGSTHDLGTWELARGFRLAGQVKLTDGKPIPQFSRLVISRSVAWDTAGHELPADGRFDLNTVPGEKLEVSVALTGYRLAPGHASQDRSSPGQLTGQLLADKTNLTMVLEPGDRLEPDYSDSEEREQAGNLPLTGMEEKRAGTNLVAYSGRVVDEANGKPVVRFQIVPGSRQSPQEDEWTEWVRAQKGQGTNGAFSLNLSRSQKTRVFLIEAEGYVPAVSRPLSNNELQIEVKLKRGTGPQGKVAFPDGKPACDVSVFFISEGEQINVDREGRFNSYSGSLFSSEQTKRQTVADGSFSFNPKLKPGVVMATCSNGFAMATQETLRTNPVLVMQPWAQVRGRLLKVGKPVVGEKLDLQENTGQVRQRGPWIHFASTTTDAEGRFQFTRVPPIPLCLTARASIDNMPNAWTEVKQRDIEVSPGASVDLGDIPKTESRTPK
jgi:uncharacterized GH25 family protein